MLPFYPTEEEVKSKRRVAQSLRRQEEAKKKMNVTFSSNNQFFIYEVNKDNVEDQDNQQQYQEEGKIEEDPDYQTEQDPEDQISVCDNYDQFDISLRNHLIPQLKTIVLKESDPFNYSASTCELYPGSSLTQSLSIELINDFVHTAGLDIKNTKRLFSLLENLIPAPNKLPFHYSKKRKIVNDLEYFVPQTFISAECCPCAGYVYNGIEESRRDRCPCEIKINAKVTNICDMTRWTPCKACHEMGHCPHIANRTPQMLLQYRPIVTIIIQLLRQGEEFLRILDYSYLDDGRENNVFTDVMDSRVVTEQLAQMKAVYLNKYQGQENLVRMVNLTIAINYDGAQIFHKKVSDFHPLMISILNLPPPYRKALGVGMFLLNLFTLKTNSVCETFVLNDWLVEELVWLGEGVEMNILGKSYFVQVRLVWHGYDTRQVESSIGCSSMAAKGDPCPMCASVRGCLSHEMKKAGFSDDRHKLPLRHALRGCGILGRCCPKDYYSPSYNTKTIVNFEVSKESLTVKRRYRGKITANQLQLCNREDSEKILEIIRDTERFEWYHSRYDFNTFSTSVWTAYYDYRPFCEYTRISQADYKKYTEEAMELGDYINGFHTKWPFDRLKYMDFGRMINWDPFHSMKNFAHQLLCLLDGTRTVGSAALDYYKRIKAFPFLYNTPATNVKKGGKEAKVVAPWAVVSTPELKAYIDEYISSIMYPKGTSKDFSIKTVFHQMGFLNGTQLIQATSILMDFIIYAIRREIPTSKKREAEPYLAFFSLAGEDLCLLQQPQFKEEEIDPLYFKLVELVVLHHLLFGAYEAKIAYHQLTDLPPFIREFGPIKGWSTLAAERAIGKVKDHKTKGGVHLHLPVFKRQVRKESVYLKSVYSNKIPELNYTPILTDILKDVRDTKTTIIDPVTNQVSYSNQLFRLSNPYDETITLNGVEVRKLLILLVQEVKKAVGLDEEKALKASGLFRLHYSFQKLRSGYKYVSYTKEQFFDWLMDYDDLYPALVIIDRIVTADSDIRSWIKHGAVIKDDLDKAIEVCTNFKVRPYWSAVIFGTKFESRGIECREENEGILNGRYGQENIIPIPHKALNLLRKHFWDPSHYSSWFCCQHKSDNTSGIGQFNGFFRINLVHEPILHGIPCGFMTGRRFKIVEHTLMQITCDDRSYDDKYFFVPLTDVYSTQIGIVAIDSNNKPISQDTIQNRREKQGTYLQELLLIELHKPRKCIVYESKDVMKYNNMGYDDPLHQ